MGEWQETDFGLIPIQWDLKKVIEIKSNDRRAIAMGPFGSNIKAENFVDKGVPVIRGTNLNFPKFVGGNFVFLTEEKADELIGSVCKAGDLVFTHRGTIGQVGLIPSNHHSRYVISQSGMKLTVDSNIINNEFLFYFFKSEFGQYQILKYESQVGVPSISNPLTSLKEMQVPVPPLLEQTAIATILSSLDDKIDLLQRQNVTLEKMAETLFRQWFVEEVKEEWEIDTLGKLFDIGIGRTPPRKEHQWFSENPLDLKWVSIKDMGNSGVYISNVSEYLTEEAVVRFNIPIIPTNTVMLSFKMTIGRLAITTESMLSNEAIAHFKVKKNSKLYSEFLYLYLKTYQWEQLGSTSSIVEAINSQMIKEMEIIIPEDDLLIGFKEIIEPYFQKIKSNQTQIRTLSAMRDILLPKLMSGEVRVEM
ncbi:MAG TPA: restriction endonuclease subunit S [Leadbetterella sp.]|nr:restriction endonuclease subunit S [Leadbetterella sp.]